jgi:hypothetical protein
MRQKYTVRAGLSTAIFAWPLAALERPAGFAYAAGCNDLPTKSFSI